MADDEQSSSVENSVGGGSPSGKRKPKKKHYPFGTPSHKVPFSQYNHLKSTDILFFQEISQSEGIQAEIRSGDEDLTRISGKGGKGGRQRMPVKVDDDFLKYAQPTKQEDGVELCKRIDCRSLLRKILESMSTFQLERENIGIEIELSGNECGLAEQEAMQLEEKLKMISRENDQLEATLEHLNSQVAKLEAKKTDLQQERDEFGNKVHNFNIYVTSSDNLLSLFYR
jgi:cell division protein FtsB